MFLCYRTHFENGASNRQIRAIGEWQMKRPNAIGCVCVCVRDLPLTRAKPMKRAIFTNRLANAPRADHIIVILFVNAPTSNDEINKY